MFKQWWDRLWRRKPEKPPKTYLHITVHPNGEVIATQYFSEGGRPMFTDEYLIGLYDAQAQAQQG